MIRIAPALCFATLLAACQTTEPAPEPDPPAFVEAVCGGCHGVEPPFLSPEPEAPTFAAIANRRGLSESSLADWLANAHNYPEAMDFDLTRERADMVASYMITLRRPDYEPDM
jgi:mono/diheme cytochrome c family protein